MYSFKALLALLCPRNNKYTYDLFLKHLFSFFSPFIKLIIIISIIMTNTKAQTKCIHFFQWRSPDNTYTINELFLKHWNDGDRSSDMFIGIEYDEKLCILAQDEQGLMLHVVSGQRRNTNVRKYYSEK